MNSRENVDPSESPTSQLESEQPLIGAADNGNMISGYDGGVAVLSSSVSSNLPTIQAGDSNGLDLSEALAGGTGRSDFRVSGHPNQRSFNSMPYNSHQQAHSYPKGRVVAGTHTNGVLMHPVSQGGGVCSPRGKEVMANLRKAYEWHDRFDSPSQEFLSLMDRLYMECQVHLSNLSSKEDLESRQEADIIVQEMIVVRNCWGTKLLPNSICNAFVRERIPHTVDRRQFRVDCAQFFEPVPFYGSQQTDNPGELMKLYRFSVYDLSRNEVVIRYYLERSNVTQLYHVLCFTCNNYRGQVYPFGSECPSYWEVRQHMIEDVRSRLKSFITKGAHPPPATHAATYLPPTSSSGPVIIQIPS